MSCGLSSWTPSPPRRKAYPSGLAQGATPCLYRWALCALVGVWHSQATKVSDIKYSAPGCVSARGGEIQGEPRGCREGLETWGGQLSRCYTDSGTGGGLIGERAGRGAGERLTVREQRDNAPKPRILRRTSPVFAERRHLLESVRRISRASCSPRRSGGGEGGLLSLLLGTWL